jgi:hypothetical protein
VTWGMNRRGSFLMIFGWFFDDFGWFLMIPDDFWRLQGRLSWDGLKHAVGRTLNLWLGLHHQGSYH